MINSIVMHRVERVEIEHDQSVDGKTGWTNFIFHDKDGSKFTVSVFSAELGLNYVSIFNSSGQEHAACMI